MSEEITRLRKQLDEAIDFLQEFAGSPVEFEDFRVRWMTIQVPVTLMNDAKAWLAANKTQ
jgi:hypothetical protein